MRTAKPLSARDLDTLRRLDARYGRQQFLELIKSMPEPPSRRKPGAPQQVPLRPAFLTALYYFATCRRRTSISAFSRELPEVLEVRFGRSVANGPPQYLLLKKSIPAIEQDIRRGMQYANKKLVDKMIWFWICWRMMMVNPAWGFTIADQQHILVKPKRPRRVIEWIDAGIDAADARQKLEMIFQKQANTPS